MKTKVNAVIFDFDGVLIDSGDDLADAVLYALKRFERPLLPRAEIIGYVGRGIENLIRRSFKGCSEETASAALPVFSEYYFKNCLERTRLHKNVAETLEKIKDKKIGLVTNKAEVMSGRILEGLGISKYFDAVVGPESVKNIKPDPEGILKALKMFGIEPSNAVMVGDTFTDIQAGKNAGTKTCGVTYGIGDTVELVKAAPDFLIDDMKKFTDFIE